MKILLVEDDESMIAVLSAILTDQNYVFDVAQDGETGWDMLETCPYDLIVLDVMLPKLDGISFCRRLRERDYNVLVMLLTTRQTTSDKLLGLDSGADDYVVKPFDAEELVARIRALLRRGTTTTTPILSCGDLMLNPSTCEVTCRGQELHFSRKEYLLVELFLRHQQRVFSRSAIVDRLWALGEDPPTEDTVKSHIKSIRRKLKAVDLGDLIETLYGQGYRINPTYLSEGVPPPPPLSSSSTQMLNRAVQQVWQRTQGVTLDRVKFLEEVVQHLNLGQLTTAQYEQALQTTHKLVGALGTFGFETGSYLVQQIEGFLKSGLDQSLMAQRIRPLLASLHQELQDTSTVEPSPPRGGGVGERQHAIAPHHPLVLWVDRDEGLMAEMVKEAGVWKFRTAIAADLSTAQQVMQQEHPSVIVLDPMVSDNIQSVYQWLTDVQAQTIPIPVLFFSRLDSSVERLAVARSGGQMFLQKPTAPAQVMRAIAQVLQWSEQLDARILAVDDDTQILVTLQNLLQPQGIHLTVLDDPTQFWETLQSIQPDLLILDIAMPHFNGLDLCRSVRQDAQWNWLPVVFLTIRTDPEILRQVFSVGADDYVPKPIVPEELLIRIRNRLQRSRLLRSQAETDALTGVANRQRAVQMLNQFLQFSCRSQQPVCLAVLDLDHFKQVNDRQGHLQGDQVLRQFGQFLKQKFRMADVVCRWGGEEFVIGMYNITREDGLERIAEVLEEWRSLPTLTVSSCQVTFSAGVAQYPIDGTDLQMLYRTADAALYRAKAAGRNRVFGADWHPPQNLTPLDVLLVWSDDALGRSLYQALQTRGQYVQWVQTGQDALDWLAPMASHVSPRSIVLAETVVDGTGLDWLAQFPAKVRQQSRILVMLAHSERAEQAQTAGAFDYVLPPLSLPVLLQRIRHALRPRH